jgi:hypothetical protein
MGECEVAQIMYTHVSKCKNDKVKKKIPGTFLFPPYFFYKRPIVEQCVVQLPIVCIFSAADFVVEF